ANGAANPLTSNCQITANITDGSATHLGVVKNGTATSTWDLRAANGNTYSGDTIVNGGGLRLNSLGASSPNSNYIVNKTGTIRFSMTGQTIKSMTVNLGGVTSGSSDSVVTLIATNAGPALTLNQAGATSPVSLGAVFNLTGTVAGQGGVKLTNDNATPQVSW